MEKTRGWRKEPPVKERRGGAANDKLFLERRERSEGRNVSTKKGVGKRAHYIERVTGEVKIEKRRRVGQARKGKRQNNNVLLVQQ